jgi:hypothetical protein
MGVVDHTAWVRVTPAFACLPKDRNGLTFTFLLRQVLQPFDLQGAPPMMSECVWIVPKLKFAACRASQFRGSVNNHDRIS